MLVKSFNNLVNYNDDDDLPNMEGEGFGDPD